MLRGTLQGILWLWEIFREILLEILRKREMDFFLEIFAEFGPEVSPKISNPSCKSSKDTYRNSFCVFFK